LAEWTVEDQVVLVRQRNASLIAGGIGRVERQFGQEALTGWITGRNLFTLDQVGTPRLGLLMDAIEVRLVPEARTFEVGSMSYSIKFEMAEHIWSGAVQIFDDG
jgi:hypothetical protein